MRPPAPMRRSATRSRTRRSLSRGRRPRSARPRARRPPASVRLTPCLTGAGSALEDSRRARAARGPCTRARTRGPRGSRATPPTNVKPSSDEVEGVHAPAAEDESRGGDSREEVERERVPAGVARLPLGEPVRERWVEQHQPVVVERLELVRTASRAPPAARARSAPRPAPRAVRATTTRSVTARSTVRDAPRAALPCRFAHTTRIGIARKALRDGRRASEARSQTRPV